MPSAPRLADDEIHLALAAGRAAQTARPGGAFRSLAFAGRRRGPLALGRIDRDVDIDLDRGRVVAKQRQDAFGNVLLEAIDAGGCRLIGAAVAERLFHKAAADDPGPERDSGYGRKFLG